MTSHTRHPIRCLRTKAAAGGETMAVIVPPPAAGLAARKQRIGIVIGDCDWHKTYHSVFQKLTPAIMATKNLELWSHYPCCVADKQGSANLVMPAIIYS